MSRFYKIDIDNGAHVITNQVGGKLDPGGLRVEWDIQGVVYGAPSSQSTLKIWGVPLTAQGIWPGIAQASDLNNKTIAISGGMQDGLPFATANTPFAGPLVTGSILSAYGNWLGLAQTLDFVITADGGAGATDPPSQSNPANFGFVWAPGQKLKEALVHVFNTALPGVKQNINISDALVYPGLMFEIGFYPTLQAFGRYIKQVSQSIIPSPYPGVSIWMDGSGAVNATDTTVQGSSPTITLKFEDLIGQPTWLDAFTISFNTVMRSDISIDSQIILPPLAGVQAQTGPQSNAQARNRSAFQGTWTPSYIRHVGDSRAPDALSWITNFQAYSNQAPDSVTGAATSA